MGSELYDASQPWLSAGAPKGNNQGLVLITLAATTTLLHQVAFNRRAWIKRIVLLNSGAASTALRIGHTVDGTTATAFTRDMVGIVPPLGLRLELNEEDIGRMFEDFNPTQNILCQMTVATTSLEVRLEGVEY